LGHRVTVVETFSTPWAVGRLGGTGATSLLFGRMYEDPSIELDALRGRSNILAIASAGDTVIALARAGHRVTAVDINPSQISYVAERLQGGPSREGQADRLLSIGRQLLRPAGWTRTRLGHLSAMTDCAAQVVEWRRLTSGVSGAALRAVLSPAALRVRYRAEFTDAAAHLRGELALRIEHGLAAHANSANPWAQVLFTGRWPDLEDASGPIVDGVCLHCADIATHLEQVPAGTYDGFTLSNMLDGTPDAYRRRLFTALRRAGTPGAIVVLRTLGTAAHPAAAADAVRDRALIWGGLTIATIEELQ
jgi:hypothetical protein